MEPPAKPPKRGVGLVHLLYEENKIITELNSSGIRKFQTIHLIGHTDPKQTTMDVYETRFFGRIAIDAIKYTADKDVSALLKKMGSGLVNAS